MNLVICVLNIMYKENVSKCSYLKLCLSGTNYKKNSAILNRLPYCMKNNSSYDIAIEINMHEAWKFSCKTLTYPTILINIRKLVEIFNIKEFSIIISVQIQSSEESRHITHTSLRFLFLFPFRNKTLILLLEQRVILRQGASRNIIKTRTCSNSCV